MQELFQKIRGNFCGFPDFLCPAEVVQRIREHTDVRHFIEPGETGTDGAVFDTADGTVCERCAVITRADADSAGGEMSTGFGGRTSVDIERDDGTDAVAVYRDTGKRMQPADEFGGEGTFMEVDFFRTDMADPADSCEKTGDGGERQGTGFEAFRQFGGHGGIEGMDARAAFEKGTERHIGCGEEHSDAHRTEQSLMPRHTKSGDVHFFEIDREMSGALGRIDDEMQTVFRTETSDFLQRKYAGADIRLVRNDDDPGIRTEHTVDIAENFVIPAGRIKEVELYKSRIRKCMYRTIYGVMGVTVDQDMASGFGKPLDCTVECMGGVLGKDNTFGIASEKSGGSGTAFIDQFRGGIGEPVGTASRISSGKPHGVSDGTENRFRFRPCRSGIVKINGFQYPILPITSP